MNSVLSLPELTLDVHHSSEYGNKQQAAGTVQAICFVKTYPLRLPHLQKKWPASAAKESLCHHIIRPSPA